MVVNIALATYSQRRSNSTGTTRMEFLVGTGAPIGPYNVDLRFDVRCGIPATKAVSCSFSVPFPQDKAYDLFCINQWVDRMLC